MPTAMTIRAADASDVLGLLELYNHLSTNNVPYASEKATANLAKLAAYDGSAVLLGEVGPNLVATCTLIVIPNLTRGGLPYAVIENVVTHPDHRQRGYGKAMLDAACDRAWAHDCYKIMLSTGSKRPETLSFHESAGFTQSRTGFQKRNLPARTEAGGTG